MKRLLFITISALVLCSCRQAKETEEEPAIKAAPVKRIPTPSIPEEEKEKYHDLVERFFQKTGFLRNFNGSILIAKNGVPVYEHYQGFADFKAKDTIGPETPFQIASTSKPFTAAAVLKLVEEGRLNLDAPLTDFFPGFPYPGITVKNLLTHRSGLPEYIYYMDQGDWPRETLATNEDVLKTLFEWKPPRAYNPDTRFNYCNTNYVLLALIVEKVTSTPFPEHMKKTFFEPLGMENTFIVTLDDSTSYQSYDGYGSLWKKDFSDGPYGDKNMYSTPRDLLKWDQAWYHGMVLKNEWADSVITPYSHERKTTQNYGLGWRLLFTKTGKKVIYHNGHWHGFNSAFARLTEEKGTIIIISNKFNRNIYPMGRALYNVFGNYDGKHPEPDN